VDKGADDQGIARGTSGIYNALFGNKPAGSRDSWQEDEQRRITVAENFASNHVRGLPNEERSQSQANDDVVRASSDGARAAREYIEDESENGNWWSRLFGS
jgi:hypothetical protein